MEHKKIKIPKIGEKQVLHLYINRSEITELPSTKYEVTLKPGEVVMGMKIPIGIQMITDHISNQFSSRPFITLFAKEANDFLKMLYLNELRNKK